MKYNLDLSKMSIDKYEIFLKNQYLIPAGQILRENIGKNFKAFKNYGLKNILDLKQAISTPSKKILYKKFLYYNNIGE